MGAQQTIRLPAQMHRHLLLDPALEASLRPAALGVSPVQLTGDGRELAQAAGTAAKQPRCAAAHDRDAPTAGDMIAARGSSHGTVSTTASGSTGMGSATISRISAGAEKIASPRAPRPIAEVAFSHP